MKTNSLNSLVLLMFFMLSTSFSSSNSDRCTDWQPWGRHGRESRIFIKICEYESGDSGYYKFKNENDIGVRISFTLTFNDGTTWKGSQNLAAHFTDKYGSACSSCSSKRNGVKSWELTKIIFEGEKGYW